MRLLFLILLLFAKILNADLAFITDPGQNEVFVFDTETNLPVTSIPVGSAPQGIDVAPNRQFVYAVNTGTNNVSVIDPVSFSVIATVTVGTSPVFVAIAPNSSRAYVTNLTSGTVSVINTAVNSVIATITVGTNPRGVTVTPNGQFVYVANNGSSTVSVINTATNAVVATIAITSPVAAAASPNGNIVYISDTGGGTISVVSTATNSVVATISGVSTSDIVFSSSGALAYTSMTPINIIDTATHTVIDTAAAAGNQGIDLTFNQSFLYAVGVDGESPGVIYAMDTATNTALLVFSDPDAAYSRVSMLAQSIPSPFGPTGFQFTTRFLTQSDFINEIRWNPPIFFSPVSYNIYRDAALTDLAGSVPASKLKFKDRNRQKKHFYTYFIVAVDEMGATLNLGSVTVAPIL